MRGDGLLLAVRPSATVRRGLRLLSDVRDPLAAAEASAAREGGFCEGYGALWSCQGDRAFVGDRCVSGARAADRVWRGAARALGTLLR